MLKTVSYCRVELISADASQNINCAFSESQQIYGCNKFVEIINLSAN